jgi:hypothetical protein
MKRAVTARKKKRAIEPQKSYCAIKRIVWSQKRAIEPKELEELYRFIFILI